MREDQEPKADDHLIDLGAATERTLGPWDPWLKENHITPESFPM